MALLTTSSMNLVLVPASRMETAASAASAIAKSVRFGNMSENFPEHLLGAVYIGCRVRLMLGCAAAAEGETGRGGSLALRPVSAASWELPARPLSKRDAQSIAWGREPRDLLPLSC